MRIGFTGTRRGLGNSQGLKLRATISSLEVGEFHHGDCIGADEQAHDIVRQLVPNAHIVSHPPKNTTYQAFTKSDQYWKPKEYMVRNDDIVRETQLLIACPWEMDEQIRSGTWATVRRARKAGKPVIVIQPNGTLKRR